MWFKKKKEKEYLNQEHKNLVIGTKKLLRKDLGFFFMIFLSLMFLIYDSIFKNWLSFLGNRFSILEFLIVIVIFIIIGYKEKNSFLLENNMISIKNFNEKLKLKKN